MERNNKLQITNRKSQIAIPIITGTKIIQGLYFSPAFSILFLFSLLPISCCLSHLLNQYIHEWHRSLYRVPCQKSSLLFCRFPYLLHKYSPCLYTQSYYQPMKTLDRDC